jgi:mannose-6-phosphate isomerase-like protein (cupin superfamily)
VQLKAGDTALVRRGQVHFFINTGDAPASALATFAPPYDGRDNVPAE